MFLRLNSNYIDCSFWRTYGSGAHKKKEMAFATSITMQWFTHTRRLNSFATL